VAWGGFWGSGWEGPEAWLHGAGRLKRIVDPLQKNVWGLGCAADGRGGLALGGEKGVHDWELVRRSGGGGGKNTEIREPKKKKNSKQRTRQKTDAKNFLVGDPGECE